MIKTFKNKQTATIKPTENENWLAKIINHDRMITHEKEFKEYAQAKDYVEKLLGWR